MKKIFTLSILSLCLLLSHAQAQITITTNDLPSAGDLFRMSNGSAFTGMDPTLTGPSYTWDYSQLTANSQVVDTFISVANTAQLFSLAFLFSANQATPGNSFSLGTVTVDHVYNFYKNSSSSYKQVGFGANVMGVPMPITYNPQDYVYRLPLNYNDLDSSNSSYSINLTAVIGFYLRVNRHRVNQVDGWGSLTTPFGTFDALRIKSTVTEVDSFQIDTILHTGFTLPPITNIEYKWLGTGQGVPLLQINTGALGNVSSIVYRDSVRTFAGIENVDMSGFDFGFFPNPASSKVYLAYELNKKADVTVSLLDLKGSLLIREDHPAQESGKQFAVIDLQGRGIADGTYLLRMEVNGRSFTKQILVGK